MILFLHGSGERGHDNRKQLAVGLGPHVLAHADTFPAVVVFPQAPPDGNWVGEPGHAAIAALDAATADFDGDPARTYLTGLSLGGTGTWWIGRHHAPRFAALVPICGWATPPELMGELTSAPSARDTDPITDATQELAYVPTWMFHGSRDSIVPPSESRRMADVLRTAGADVRYTEFPDADHNSWDAAYAAPELWDWLFAQRRRQPSWGAEQRWASPTTATITVRALGDGVRAGRRLPRSGRRGVR